MLVGQAVVAGTVGGGALELACEQHAHAMLCSGEVVREHQIVLGGQMSASAVVAVWLSGWRC